MKRLTTLLLVACSSSYEPYVFPETDEQPILAPAEMRSFEGADDPEPPPLSGGTMLATRDGRFAYAANPDRGAVEIVDLQRSEIVKKIDIHDELGRMVEDSEGRVHVVMRRRGLFATITNGDIVVREACPAPRGIATDGALVFIACASGEIVQRSTDPQVAGVNHILAPRDLRDIIVRDGKLYVTTFRSAELLTLDAEGRVVRREAPRRYSSGDTQYEPEVAWKVSPGVGGSIWMLHQLATTASLGPVYYTGSAPPVVTALTKYVNGAPVWTRASEKWGPAVDFAVLADGTIALATTKGSIDIVDPEAPPRTPGRTVKLGFSLPTSIAPLGEGWLAQTRERDVLLRFDAKGTILGSTPLSPTHHHKGFLVFHTPTSGGVACMSCHPEGGEDGRTWKFAIGPRRTQALRGGLLATAPFHWDGDLPDISHFTRTVYRGRMNGPELRQDQVDSLGRFLDRVPALPPPAILDAGAVARGKDVFTRRGCGGCHAGASFTSPANQNIGTQTTLQVPSLINVGYRAPYMHDGCAATLKDRFTLPACGGRKHGNTAGMSDGELSDMLAYLESL